MSKVINSTSTVTLNFSLALENGDLVDSTFGKAPATFAMGDGSLLPGFEKRLQGLQAADKKEFVIPAAEGFGRSNIHNIMTYQRTDFSPEIDLDAGVVVSFTDPSGRQIPGVIKTVAEMVTVDFNHPLAGHDLTFTVEIIDVQ